MAKFFKSLLLTIVGSIFTALFIVLLIFLIISGIASSSEKHVKIKENTLLTIDLNKVIKDRAVSDPLTELLGESPFGEPELGLNKILKNIEKASKDKNINGIYLECGSPMAGYATLGEIREALKSFKDSGKFVTAYAPSYSQKGYYVASVANEVYMPAQGSLDFKGISSQRTFFKGTLEKLGIEIQIFKYGKYKSAVEPFILNKMSDPAKEQTIAYTSSIWNNVAKDISASKGLSVDKLNQIADNGSMFVNSQLYLEAGLLSGIKYKDEVIEKLKEKTGTQEDDDIEQVTLSDYDYVYIPKETKGLIKDKIAVIYAEGDIDGTDDDGIKSEELSKTIRKARRDKSIKAVVLRVNSPGGSALGSDIIGREIDLCKKAKPVIVSMGDLAASGGYWISCTADTIVANPTTITGSIGVFGMIPNTKKLMNQKLGITFDGVKTNKFSDMPTITRPFNEDEKAIIQSSINSIYESFINRCAEGRSTTDEKIDEIGQGRVWSGENAMDINLVDVMGGLKTAIEIAREKAGLETYRIKELPEKLSPLEELFKDMKTETKAYITESFLGINYKELEIINKVKSIEPIQARLPYSININ